MTITQSQSEIEIMKKIKNYHVNKDVYCEVRNRGDEGIEVIVGGKHRFMNLSVKEKNIYINSLSPRYSPRYYNYETNTKTPLAILENLFEIAHIIGARKIIAAENSNIYPQLKGWMLASGFKSEEGSGKVLELDKNKNVLLLKHFKMIAAIKNLMKRNPSFYGTWDCFYDNDFDDLGYTKKIIKEKRYRTDSLHFCYYYYYKGLIGSMTMTYDNDGLFLVENAFLNSERISQNLNTRTIGKELLSFLEKAKMSGRTKLLLSPSDFYFKLKIFSKWRSFPDNIIQNMFHHFLVKFGNIDELEKALNNTDFSDNTFSRVWEAHFPDKEKPRYPEKEYDLRYFQGTYILAENLFRPLRVNVYLFEDIKDVVDFLRKRDVDRNHQLSKQT